MTMLDDPVAGPPIAASRAPRGRGNVTARQAEDLFGIPAERIARWRNRRVVAVTGYLGRYPTYRISDLRELNRRADADPRSGKRGERAG